MLKAVVMFEGFDLVLAIALLVVAVFLMACFQSLPSFRDVELEILSVQLLHLLTF